MRTFSVKNFDRFQHYKDRNPPWIKLYNELLDDYDFGALPDASKMHLIAIWLLASRSNNKIPYDPEWIGRRINATSKVDLAVLERYEFIVVNQEVQDAEQVASNPLADCKQDAMPETETETEKRQSREDTCAVAKATRPRATYDEKFEEAWRAYPRRDGANPKAPSAKLFLSAVKAGADPDQIIAGVQRYAAAEQRNIGTPFIPQMVKWLRDKRWLDYDGSVVPIKFDVRKHLV